MTSTLPMANSLNNNNNTNHSTGGNSAISDSLRSSSNRQSHDVVGGDEGSSSVMDDSSLRVGGNYFLPMQKIDISSMPTTPGSPTNCCLDLSQRSTALSNSQRSTLSRSGRRRTTQQLCKTLLFGGGGSSHSTTSRSTGSGGSSKSSSSKSSSSSTSKWRKHFITPQISGNVLELGASLENLPLYSAKDNPEFHLTVVDSRQDVLEQVREWATTTTTSINNGSDELVFQHNQIQLCHATDCRQALPVSDMDWVVSTTMDASVQWGNNNNNNDFGRMAILGQINKCLKPGGQFRILDVVLSRNAFTRLGQRLSSKKKNNNNNSNKNKKNDINIITYLKGHPDLSLDKIEYLQGDTHILIEGHKRTHKKRSTGSVKL